MKLDKQEIVVAHRLVAEFSEDERQDIAAEIQRLSSANGNDLSGRYPKLWPILLEILQ